MLALLLMASSLLLALACLLTRQRRIARITRAAGVAVFCCGALALLSGLVLTWSSASAPGLSAADRTRMLANGQAEALQSALLVAVFSTPALLASSWVLRKAASKDSTQAGSGASADR